MAGNQEGQRVMAEADGSSRRLSGCVGCPLHRRHTFQLLRFEAISANFGLTAFQEVRRRKSCLTMVQVLEQTLDQEPVHLEDLDPPTRMLDEAPAGPRPEAAVGDLEVAHVVQEIDARLLVEAAVVHGRTAHRPPTCMTGRLRGSGSASLSTSWVTGAVSPSPKRM